MGPSGIFFTGDGSGLEQKNIASVCRYVILGNHRDAWAFGAVDPNSGTAALLEIGVTEWIEENRKLLASSVVA
ncbi:hypothetical protein S83_066703, partial [Arachis hypogaea]